MASSSLTKNLSKTFEEPIKENGIWIFSDTECKEDKKVCYTWTSLFQAFQDKEFVVLLQNDASTALSKEIYKSCNEDPCITMTRYNRMDNHEDRSSTSINLEC